MSLPGFSGSVPGVGIKGLEVPDSGHGIPWEGSVGFPRAAPGQGKSKERWAGASSVFMKRHHRAIPGKSWRGSKLQPRCPAHAFIAATPLPFFPPGSVAPSRFPALSLLRDPGDAKGILALPASACGFKGGDRKIRVGSPLGRLCLQHRGYLGWRDGRGRGRQ